MTDTTGRDNIWFPGPDKLYKGREDVYAEPAHGFGEDELVVLVQARIQEDGAWVLENDLATGSEEIMRKMMAWASDSRNIIQAYNRRMEYGPTVDWVCRELANAAKMIAEGVRG